MPCATLLADALAGLPHRAGDHVVTPLHCCATELCQVHTYACKAAMYHSSCITGVRCEALPSNCLYVAQRQ
jgi:hypothetical protein